MEFGLWTKDGIPGNCIGAALFEAASVRNAHLNFLEG